MNYKKNKQKDILKQVFLVIAGIIFGVLIITQARYFTSYVNSEARESNENSFIRKIQILKTSTDDLKEEIKDLEKQFEELSNQAFALQTIEDEIVKNSIIAGEVDVFGTGIELEFDTSLTDIWFIDLTNELFTIGAEAISINNIRLVDTTIGFDTLPNGQIMVNSVILSPPYTFAAIGDKTTLKSALTAPYGILDRMEAGIENLEYTLEEKDRIEMGEI